MPGGVTRFISQLNDESKHGANWLFGISLPSDLILDIRETDDPLRIKTRICDVGYHMVRIRLCLWKIRPNSWICDRYLHLGQSDAHNWRIARGDCYIFILCALGRQNWRSERPVYCKPEREIHSMAEFLCADIVFSWILHDDSVAGPFIIYGHFCATPTLSIVSGYARLVHLSLHRQGFPIFALQLRLEKI